MGRVDNDRIPILLLACFSITIAAITILMISNIIIIIIEIIINQDNNVNSQQYRLRQASDLTWGQPLTNCTGYHCNIRSYNEEKLVERS